MEFTQAESCGKCVPCRVGTKRILEILTASAMEKGKMAISKLWKCYAARPSRTVCAAWAKAQTNPVVSTLKHFRSEYEAHIYDKKCPQKPARRSSIMKSIRKMRGLHHVRPGTAQ
jgi:NADH:ubiquinone oxidoreductase subunit F (NADH-binding)